VSDTLTAHSGSKMQEACKKHYQRFHATKSCGKCPNKSEVLMGIFPNGSPAIEKKEEKRRPLCLSAILLNLIQNRKHGRKMFF
jgi:hypothetical protein